MISISPGLALMKSVLSVVSFLGAKNMGENRCSYIMKLFPSHPPIPSPSPHHQSPGLLRREKVQYEENSLTSCNPNTNLQTILPPTRWARKTRKHFSNIISTTWYEPPLSTSGWITRNSWWMFHHIVVTKKEKSILQFRKLCSNTLYYHVRKVDQSKQLLSDSEFLPWC